MRTRKSTSHHLPSIILLLAALACHKDDEGVAAASAVGVRTAVAQARAFPEIVSAIGTVTPRPGRFADLSAPAATRVSRVEAVPGQRVAAGAVLVEFERAPFDAAAHSADAALSAAQATWDRAVRLAQAGVLPRKDVDQAASELAQAQSAVVIARRSLELATLRAPIAGVVTRMDAVLGQPVEANQALVQVVDESALDIVFAVSADAASRVHPGAAVRITAGEDARGDSLGSGSVTSVGASVDPVSRAVLVRARIVRPSRPLRVGETVMGRITVGVHANAVTIPVDALVPAGEGFKVFVVDSSGLARAREVTVGGRADSLVEVRLGLAAGETVVTYGAYGLEDSVRVVRAGP